MKSIRDARGALEWIQPATLKREFELRSGDEVVARLRWEKLLGSLAVGEASDGSWTFKRAGFLNPRVLVRAAGSDADIASFRPSWKGDGRVEMADGRRYRFEKISFWRNEWAFDADDGTRIVHFHSKFALLKYAADVTIESGASVPDLAMLAMLGFYLIVLMSDDAGGAAAAAAAG